MIFGRAQDYELTLAGRVAKQFYSDYWERLEKALPLLELVQKTASFDPVILERAKIVNAEFSRPQHPIKILGELVEQGSELRGIAPCFRSQFDRLYYSKLTNAELAAETVLSYGCVDCIRDEWPEKFDELTSSDRFSLSVIDDTPPYSLAVVDEQQVWLGVHNDRGIINGAIINDSPEAVAWSVDILDQYRRRANRWQSV